VIPRPQSLESDRRHQRDGV